MASTLQVIYSRHRTLAGWLVRLAQWWGPWSHCGIVTPEGTVIHAVWGRGVVETPWNEYVRVSSRHELVDVHVPSPDLALTWLRLQLGKGYDYGAVFRFISGKFRWIKASPGRFHCAELVETAIFEGGLRRFRVPLSQIGVVQSYSVV